MNFQHEKTKLDFLKPDTIYTYLENLELVKNKLRKCIVEIENGSEEILHDYCLSVNKNFLIKKFLNRKISSKMWEHLIEYFEYIKKFHVKIRENFMPLVSKRIISIINGELLGTDKKPINDRGKKILIGSLSLFQPNLILICDMCVEYCDYLIKYVRETKLN